LQIPKRPAVLTAAKQLFARPTSNDDLADLAKALAYVKRRNATK